MDERTDEPDGGAPTVDPMSAVALLLGGLTVWGALGWLTDRLLDLDGVFLPAGLVLGAALAVYMTYLRYARP